jgi:hypothetical protein
MPPDAALADALRVLGILPAPGAPTPPKAAVRRAFHARALLLHPDKRRAAPGAGGGRGGGDDAFVALHHAYRVAVAKAPPDQESKSPDERERAGARPTPGEELTEAALRALTLLARCLSARARVALEPSEEVRAAALRGLLMMTYWFAVRARGAPPDVRVRLHVALHDLYHGRVVRVVLPVFRHGRGGGGRQTLHVSLLDHVAREAGSAAPATNPAPEFEYRFPGAGDDPVLPGAAARGDAVVILCVDAHALYRIDDVLCRLDLVASYSVALHEYLYGTTLRLPHPGSAPDDACAAPLCVAYAPGQRVALLPGLGLPFTLPDGSRGRGTLTVVFELRPPSPDAPVLAEPAIRDAVYRLSQQA